jgi:flagellin
MSTINTNISSLIAQNAFNTNTQNLNTSLERLSTGLKINSGADDPAGLIASNALQAEATGINAAISNANQANNVIGTASGGLSQTSSLLNELQGLVTQSANSGALSPDEISANQLQVDSILSTINRISNSTNFQGQNLLDGSLAYTLSGAGTSAFAAISVNAANLPSNNSEAVVVQVTNSATLGQLKYTGTANALAASGVTLQVAGSTGTEQLSFAGSTKLSAIAAAINNVTQDTGVTASANGSTLTFSSSNYGSTQFVSVQTINPNSGYTITGGSGGKAFGKDAVVSVNGAAATVNGTQVTYRSDNLDLNFTLSTAGTGGGLNHGNTKTFAITGGGATFSLGAEVNASGKASIGIQSVSTSSLGDATLGYLSSLGTGGANSLTSKNLSTAQQIVSEAINQVSTLSGRLGAFQKYTLGPTTSSLNVAYENISAANSAIEDTDFASETANLTREQILQQASTTVLSTANSAPQAVLTLLQHS